MTTNEIPATQFGERTSTGQPKLGHARFGSHLGAVTLSQMTLWEIVALAAAAMLMWGGFALQPSLLLSGLTLFGLLIVVWFSMTKRGHYWRYEWVVIRWRLLGRQASRANLESASDGRAANQDPVAWFAPGLKSRNFVDRRGIRHGMLSRAESWTVVLEVRCSRHPIVGARSPLLLSAGLLSSLLQAEDDRLATAQLVTMTVPRRHGEGPYRQSAWLALRLDPTRCPNAVEARGGGLEGAHRALANLAARVTGQLAVGGIEARVLDVEQAQGALRRCLGLPDVDNARRPSAYGALVHPQRQQTEESWTGWQHEETLHTTYWVHRWPHDERAATTMISQLEAVPAWACVMSTALSPYADRGLETQTMVRYLGPALHLDSESDDLGSGRAPELIRRRAPRLIGKSADEVNHEIQEIARHWKAQVVRLDGEHFPGVAMTLPLAHGAQFGSTEQVRR